MAIPYEGSVVKEVETKEVKKEKKEKSLLGLMFAFLPTHCRACDKLIWLRFFYGMSWWNVMAYDYGSCANEHHCIECHRHMIKEDGHCTWCTGWAK